MAAETNVPSHPEPSLHIEDLRKSLGTVSWGQSLGMMVEVLGGDRKVGHLRGAWLSFIEDLGSLSYPASALSITQMVPYR